MSSSFEGPKSYLIQYAPKKPQALAGVRPEDWFDKTYKVRGDEVVKDKLNATAQQHIHNAGPSKP